MRRTQRAATTDEAVSPIVGVILMVVMNVTKDWEHICNMDLVNNLVTSAVAD